MIGRFACPEPLCAQIESLRASARPFVLTVRDGDLVSSVIEEIRIAMPIGVWMRTSAIINSQSVSVGSTLVRKVLGLMLDRGDLSREILGRNKTILWRRDR